MQRTIKTISIIFPMVLSLHFSGCNFSEQPTAPEDHSEVPVKLSSFSDVVEFIQNDIHKLHKSSTQWGYFHTSQNSVGAKSPYDGSSDDKYDGIYTLTIDAIIRDATPFEAGITARDSGTFFKIRSDAEPITFDTLAQNQETVTDLIDTSGGKSGLYYVNTSLASLYDAKYFISYPVLVLISQSSAFEIIVDRVSYNSDTLLQIRFRSGKMTSKYLEGYGITSLQKDAAGQTNYRKATYDLCRFNQRPFTGLDLPIIDSNAIPVSQAEILEYKHTWQTYIW